MEAVARRIVLVAALLAATLAPASAGAATIDVTTESDVRAHDGACSLREALDSANHNARAVDADGECPAGSGADTIELPAGLYPISIAPVHGPVDQEGNDFGSFGISSAVTIRGAGRGQTTIDGAARDRVFVVNHAGTAVFENLTISGGRTLGGSEGSWAQNGAAGTGAGSGGDSIGGPGGNSEDGGGILNGGTAMIRDAAILDNSTGDAGHGGLSRGGGVGGPSVGTGGNASSGDGGDSGAGGGVFNFGTLVIERTIMHGNSTGHGGRGGAGGADEPVHGGAGGSNPSGSGGDGGDAHGGSGGDAGGGGAIASIGADSSLTIVDSRIAGNATGSGGAGESAAGGAGGPGGTECGGCAPGGDGGDGIGGDGGDGGDGAAILSTGTAGIARTTVTNNVAGHGGRGGNGYAGKGGSGMNPGPFGGKGGGPGFGLGGDSGAGGTGGISATGPLTLTASTVDRNAGGDGGSRSGEGFYAWGANEMGGAYGGVGGAGGAGGLRATDSLTALNDTVALNKGGKGAPGGDATQGIGGAGRGGAGGSGGIAAAADAALTHVTIGGNSGAAGGPAGDAGSPALPGSDGAGGVAGAATLRNSIVSGNDGPGCIGPTVDGGGDISSPDATCPGAHVDPGLGALADNGGPTRTMALAAGSPAVDLVPAAGAGCASTDQRGVARPQGTACDAGAYEDAPVSGPAHDPGPGPGPGPAQGPGPAPGPGPTPAVDGVPPVLSNVRLTDPVFAVGQLTRFRYTLSEQARVTILIGRRTAYRSSGACRVTRCIRYVAVARVVRSSRAGASSVRFRGRVGRRSLSPGRYRALLTATDAAGNRSKAVTRSFRIARR